MSNQYKFLTKAQLEEQLLRTSTVLEDYRLYTKELTGILEDNNITDYRVLTFDKPRCKLIEELINTCNELTTDREVNIINDIIYISESIKEWLPLYIASVEERRTRQEEAKTKKLKVLNES